MRHWLGALAAASLVSAAAVPLGTPLAADTSSARMLTFGEAANADQPVILRGAAASRTAAPAVAPSAPSYEIAAGRRLWLFDPATLEIRSCINQQTTDVVRRVRCYAGSLGGYSRTFGPTFQP